jgi:hypothetical protein
MRTGVLLRIDAYPVPPLPAIFGRFVSDATM